MIQADFNAPLSSPSASSAEASLLNSCRRESGEGTVPLPKKQRRRLPHGEAVKAKVLAYCKSAAFSEEPPG